MPRRACIALVIALTASHAGRAAIVDFSQSLYPVSPGGSIEVPIVVAGSELISGAIVFAQLGDGGADLGGSDTAPPFPRFTDLIIGSDNHVFPAIAPVVPPIISPLYVLGDVNSTPIVRVASGILAVLVISAVEAEPGLYPLVLSNPGAGLQTELILAGGGGPSPSELGSTSIWVTPEPLSAFLLVAGAVLIARRRNSRRVPDRF